MTGCRRSCAGTRTSSSKCPFSLKPDVPPLNNGLAIHELAQRLWPLNRSLTGNGVRESLRVISEVVPGLQAYEVPSGTRAFDWMVPEEWNVRDAWIEGPDGRRVVDFRDHNLHLVGYSIPVDLELSLEELQPHLHSLPQTPDAIPYVTSYYNRTWGFCLRHSDRLNLQAGTYRVRIDSTLAPGNLTYADVIIPGDTAEEVLLSTYICHPSLGNNELSGPCLTAYLAKWLSELPHRRFTYRVVFIPETIGSIVYLSRNVEHLKRHVIAGFMLTCVGDDRCYSYMPSRNGATLSDRVILHVLKHIAPDFKRYSYLDRGSDECQYCSPGIDLPIATMMRSKYGEYPEYHTSLDDLTVITPEGFGNSFDAFRRVLEAIEFNPIPKNTVLCIPQMGRRGLYPKFGTKESYQPVKPMIDLMAYADGKCSLLDIAETIGVPVWDLKAAYEKLLEHDLLEDSSRT
jgi:aminopeptidase-like protein